MKGTMSAAAVHREYVKSLQSFRRRIDDAALRGSFDREIDNYVRHLVLGMWHAENAAEITPRHVELYNAIYSPGKESPSALYWEVATGVANFSRRRIPEFYRMMTARQEEHGARLSRDFSDWLCSVLPLFSGASDTEGAQERRYVDQSVYELGCYQTPLDKQEQKRRDDAKPLIEQNEAGEFQISPALDTLIDEASTMLERLNADSPAPTAQSREAPKQDEAAPPPNLDEVLAELDSLCGLEQVKKDVRSLINLVKVRRLRQESGLPVPSMSLHLVFLGNPGTGKTTVARLLAKIYHALGVLSKGQLVEVDRSGLVAGFVGQTAMKTAEVIQKAIGGVLFIDEAYALVNQENANDFGHEAIEVLLKNMEDHRRDLIVIVAGYTGLMEKFIHSNPGLESRFNKYFYFEDYSGEQLMEIFRDLCEKNGYTLSEDAARWALEDFRGLYENRDENFGNARDVRNLFETAVARQSDRVAQLESPTKEQLMELLPEDLKEPAP